MKREHWQTETSSVPVTSTSEPSLSLHPESEGPDHPAPYRLDVSDPPRLDFLVSKKVQADPIQTDHEIGKRDEQHVPRKNKLRPLFVKRQYVVTCWLCWAGRFRSGQRPPLGPWRLSIHFPWFPTSVVLIAGTSYCNPVDLTTRSFEARFQPSRVETGICTWRGHRVCTSSHSLHVRTFALIAGCVSSADLGKYGDGTDHLCRRRASHHGMNLVSKPSTNFFRPPFFFSSVLFFLSFDFFFSPADEIRHTPSQAIPSLKIS